MLGLKLNNVSKSGYWGIYRANRTPAPAADSPRDIFLTVSRNTWHMASVFKMVTVVHQRA